MIDKSQAVIMFEPNGNYHLANDNFLKTLGYSLNEIAGQHHAIFLDPLERETSEYQQFWENLAQGQFQSGQYRRVDKQGNSVWIEATYNPIKDEAGDTIKVVKIATNITEKVKQHKKYELVSLVVDETDNSVIITDAKNALNTNTYLLG